MVYVPGLGHSYDEASGGTYAQLIDTLSESFAVYFLSQIG